MSPDVPRILRALPRSIRNRLGVTHLSNQLSDLEKRLDAIENGLNNLNAAERIAGARYPGGPLYFGDKTALVATRWGGRLFVYTRDTALAPCLVLEGEWEPHITAWMQANLRPGHTFLDVGASIGYFSVLAGGLVGPAGKVFSVEAHPVLAEILRRNVTLNGFYGFTRTWNAAAWSRNGDHTFHIREKFASNSSLGDIGVQAMEKLGDIAETFTVRTVILDEVLEGEPYVDVLKMDVEGAEVDAMRGLDRTLRRSQSLRIVLEWAPELMSKVGSSCGDLLDQLESHGFKTYHFESNLDPIGRSELFDTPYANILASRQSPVASRQSPVT